MEWGHVMVHLLLWKSNAVSLEFSSYLLISVYANVVFKTTNCIKCITDFCKTKGDNT